MKFKTLAILILSGLITQAHAQRLGGNSGGGGNIKPPEPLNEWTLSTFIETSIPKLVTWYFNAMNQPFAPENEKPNWFYFEGDEFGGYKREVFENAHRKMFLESETIFDRIPKAIVKVQKEKCIDPVTKEERAAAANAETNEICFSTQEIIEHSPAAELRSYIFALALHEYSHLRGTTEEEAEMIQHFGRTAAAVDGSIISGIEAMWRNRPEHVSSMHLVDNLLQSLDTVSDFRLALELSSLEKQVGADISSVNTLIGLIGLSPWSSSQRMDAIVAHSKAINLRATICKMPGINPAEDMPECIAPDSAYSIFERAGEVTMAELFKQARTQVLVPSNWKIRHVTFKDRAKIRTELTDLQTILRDLFAAQVTPPEAKAE